jgi:hypothetical protein
LIIPKILGEYFLSNILFSFIISFTHATCPVHYILLDLIALIVFGDEHKLWSSSSSPSSCYFVSLRSSLLSTLFSNTLNQCSSFSIRFTAAKI